ncbi:type II secretion system secretin GspD [Sphingomonas lacunae]|uniref:Type II secretion system secretin GspD n=1 Tax=Sphingomonas lacunae TaxID=2698828 RepID=A0A6M4AT21_9SPHN|nr:type II secretion system secretin GspD [Sphingomonas lacunae]QJQ32248.1 type II secretion system secretin GspD [Sphingomonas lacunae]
MTGHAFLRHALFGSAIVLMAAQPVLAQHVLNVRDADIRAFIADAARVTGRTFVVDGRVQGRVTVVTERPLNRAEYFEIFLSTLRANGMIAIPLPNGSYRIQPVDGAAAQPSRLGTAGAAANQLVTEVVRLRHIDATQAIETLRPLVSAQGSVTANRNANSLVVVDFADNVRRIRALVASIDRDASATRLVHLRNAGAREIAASLQQLGAGQAGANGAPATGAVTVAAFDSSNSIAIRGDAAAVERFAALANELDQRSASSAEVRVYWLNHADAARLLPTLQQLVGGGSDPVPPPAAPSSAGEGNGNAAPAPAPSAPATTTAGGRGSIVQRGPAIVTRYEGANAIIVAANADVQRQLGELIRQLDIRRRQVLVEAIVVEIGNDAARQLGVQFLLGGQNTPFVATNYSNANPNILSIGAAVAGYELSRDTTTINGNVVTTTSTNPFGSAVSEAAAQSLLTATGGFAGFAGDVGRNTVFGAIINAVQSDTASNLLATPHIVTLDNSPASFLVGQEVPVTTGERLSNNFDNAFRTVQREEVGIKLEVTPQINASGEVTLYISQEVSSVAGPVSSRSSDLVLNKRRFDTVMTADNGQIVAIGGLLNDDERRTLERVPLLSDIPLLGELFRSRSRSHARTNLMVFIRPTILENAADNAAMTARRYNFIRAEQLARDPEAEPEIDLLVRDYLGTTPPAVQPRADDVTVSGGPLTEWRAPDAPMASTAVPPSDLAPPPPQPSSEPQGQ